MNKLYFLHLVDSYKLILKKPVNTNPNHEIISAESIKKSRSQSKIH